MKRMAFNQKFFFHLWMCTSWLTARLEISTSLILFSISILCVSLRSEISPVALGLALTYGLQLNALFQRVVQVTIDVQSYMISSERIFEYCEIDPEPSTVNPFVCVREEGNVQLNTTVVADSEPLCTPSPPTAADVRFTAISKISNSSTDAIIVPVNWPSQGIVRFENVWMQYRDNPAVLRGISFSTLPAMRIGRQKNESLDTVFLNLHI